MGHDCDIAAKDVSERLLAVTGAALQSRDFESFMSAFTLPQTVRTFDATRTMTTMAEMKGAFDRMCDQFVQMNVTTIARYCIAASFKGPDRIEATHEAHLMSGTIRVKEPYPVFSVLERIGGDWKIRSSDYALDPNSGQARALLDAASAADDKMNPDTARDRSEPFDVADQNTPNSGETND